MTIYELYINGVLCDLPKDNDITLVFQSGLFTELDAIQSNRSYNIDLPMTSRNIGAIRSAQRPDVYADTPYIKMPAALYQDGIALFTRGFAVITSISDAISVTLTWGNVENFEPLFDSDMSALADTLEEMGCGYIAWDGSYPMVTRPAQAAGQPKVGFYAIDFGLGRTGFEDQQYMHPSVTVSAVVDAIERQQGISIKGKERLFGSGRYIDILPLSSNNGDKTSGMTEVIENSGSNTPTTRNGFTLLSGGTDAAYGAIIYNYPTHPELYDKGKYNTKGATDIHFEYYIVIYAIWDERPTFDNTYLQIVDSNDDQNVLYSTAPLSIQIEGSAAGSGLYYATVWFNPNDPKMPAVKDLKVQDVDGVYIRVTNGINRSGAQVIDTYGYVWMYAYPRPEVHYPSLFPVAANLPDMSQGEFLAALLTMNGLFAYADKTDPNTIGLMSADDLLNNVKAGIFVDWSKKALVNDLRLVDMPDNSEFSVGDYARNNTLDYDNDDDVKSDTEGVITIDNANLDKETELASLPFSASENNNDLGAAIVPIYSKNDSGEVDYSECSSRILGCVEADAAIGDGQWLYGRFKPSMNFGGSTGIVAAKYAGLQKILERFRIITIRAKLDAIDLYNLDYTMPVYLSQFGRLYAIYCITTGEDGICECQLVQLPIIKKQQVQLPTNEIGYATDGSTLFLTAEYPVASDLLVNFTIYTVDGFNAERRVTIPQGQQQANVGPVTSMFSRLEIVSITPDSDSKYRYIAQS